MTTKVVRGRRLVVNPECWWDSGWNYTAVKKWGKLEKRRTLELADHAAQKTIRVRHEPNGKHVFVIEPRVWGGGYNYVYFAETKQAAHDIILQLGWPSVWVEAQEYQSRPWMCLREEYVQNEYGQVHLRATAHDRNVPWVAWVQHQGHGCRYEPVWIPGYLGDFRSVYEAHKHLLANGKESFWYERPRTWMK